MGGPRKQARTGRVVQELDLIISRRGPGRENQIFRKRHNEFRNFLRGLRRRARATRGVDAQSGRTHERAEIAEDAETGENGVSDGPLIWTLLDVPGFRAKWGRYGWILENMGGTAGTPG